MVGNTVRNIVKDIVKNTARKNTLFRVINLSGILDGNMVGSMAENGKSGI